MRTSVACALIALAMTPDARAQASSGASVVAARPGATPASSRTSRRSDPASAVFDHAAAARLREEADFAGLVIVEAVRPDAPRSPRGPLERRFAAALAPPLRPAVSPHIGAVLDIGAPCLSIAGAHVSFGGHYNPHPVCP